MRYKRSNSLLNERSKRKNSLMEIMKERIIRKELEFEREE